MTLLREIQSAAISSDVDLPTLLRKCKVLAARLGNSDFKQWVDFELNGYPSTDGVPEYRKTRVQSYGSFSGPLGAAINNVALPTVSIPEDFRDHASSITVLQSVKSICSTVDGANKVGEDTLRIEWDANLRAFLQGKFYEVYSLLSAWRAFPVAFMESILDTVRNKILSFVLEIETEAPDAGEAEPGEPTLPNDRVQQVVNNFIYGDVSNFSSGGSNFSQLALTQNNAHDLDGLLNLLLSAGLPEEEACNLREAIEIDGKNLPSEGFGDRVNAWVGRMTTKIASGGGQIGIGVSINLVFEALRRYYGF